MGEGNCHIGPSDYVQWLTDRKWAYIRMEGTTFGNVPLNIEMKMEVWDSPNSAGVVIDAVRCCKVALDNGLKGALLGPSAYFKKSPPVQYTDEQARQLTEEFIAEYGGKRSIRKTREKTVKTSANGRGTSRKLKMKRKTETKSTTRRVSTRTGAKGSARTATKRKTTRRKAVRS
jgi:hypothetical protein